ncbi:hypothetical protein ACIQ8D_07650 [Streptomyces sp. NPDC096094]|uniref:hypothetical protein n=1 Tax=Streptomyces sp. NPDC096094 TaxID=3366073 RepID=UPI0037F35081
MRRSVNVLLCLAAVVAIGWSGREIWQVWDARRQIDEACAGLVPAGRVLALSPAGGRITHREADEGWWASSVCDGKPQIHTMTVSLGYDSIMIPRMEQVFRAYADDVTDRRHCADLVFPESSTFRAD